MKPTLLLFALLALCSCKAKQQLSTTITPLQLATQKLGAKLDSFPNSTGQFILFVQQQDAQHPIRMISAIVIENKTVKIVAEESFIPGYIRWTGESTLELLNAPGMVKADQDLSAYTKKINLRSINH
jgi:hypothetical protein